MISSRLLCLVASSWCGSWAVLAQSKAPDCGAPFLSQSVIEDLRSNRPERFTPNILLQMNQAGLFFTNSEQLIVYATEPSGQLSSRVSPEVSSAYILRIRLFDIPSAKTLFTKDLATRPRGSTVLATTSGFLVKTGELIKIYSPDFANSRELSLPNFRQDLLYTSMSPTGKTIIVNRINQKSRVGHFDVVDSSTSRAKVSWDQSPPLYRDYSTSDQEIAALNSNGQSIVAREFGSTKWSDVYRNSSTRSGCFPDSPTMVAGGALVVRSCKDLIFLNTTGVSYSLGSLDDGQRSDKTAVAQGGGFVAVSVDSIEVTKHLLSEPSSRITGTHIAVYDLAQKKRILTVNVDPLPKNDYDFVLSPDGSRLAVLNDREVTVYSVQNKCGGQ
jgi:hypothetical protein